MKRLVSTLFATLCLAGIVQAQEPIQPVTASTVAPIIQEERVWGPWARFHGFLFRRYAGSVEMESKTPYAKGYFGRFTYLPWQPDWVRTPANQIRSSQYRHHHRNLSRPTAIQPEFSPLPVTPDGPPQPTTQFVPTSTASPLNHQLEPVKVQNLD
ncbi:MAG: hypothetical protein AAFU85_14750 [Planctomycetota bacterium]